MKDPLLCLCSRVVQGGGVRGGVRIELEKGARKGEREGKGRQKD